MRSATKNREILQTDINNNRERRIKASYQTSRPSPTTAKKIMGVDENTAAVAASAAAMAAVVAKTHQEDLRKHLEVLDVQRRSLECESEAIVTELTTSDNPRVPPMGIDTPLVDREGFPRNDIDVLRARTLRGRLMTIRTDHKILMQQMDAQLAILTAATKTAAADGSGSGGCSDELEQRKTKEIEEEMAARSAPKPKPKFDPVTGQWVVRNWDGSIAGTGQEDGRKFDELSSEMPPTHGSTTTVPPIIIDPTSLSSSSSSATGGAGTAPATAVTSSSVAATRTQEVMTTSIHHPAAELPTVPPPLARVNMVEPGSPAAAAGLLVDDRILCFGPIHGTMDGIGDLVQHAATAHQRIGLKVQRRSVLPGDDSSSSGHNGTILLQLVLAPQPWSGRGFLGCHIVPVSE